MAGLADLFGQPGVNPQENEWLQKQMLMSGLANFMQNSGPSTDPRRANPMFQIGSALEAGLGARNTGLAGMLAASRQQKDMMELQKEKTIDEATRGVRTTKDVTLPENSAEMPSFEELPGPYRAGATIQQPRDLSEMLTDLARRTAPLDAQKAHVYASTAAALQKGTMGGDSDTQLYAKMINDPDPKKREFANAMLIFRRIQAPEAYSVNMAKRLAELETALGIKKAEGLGTGQAQIATAAEIERQKKLGAGEITPVQAKATAQDQVTGVLGQMGDVYNKLDKAGAIVSTERGALPNIGARLSASGVGQLAGTAAGTVAQSYRNQIDTMRPLLLNYIRQASQMGARGLDSEKELEFYLKAATDPKLDIQTNRKAMSVLENAYGKGARSTAPIDKIMPKSPQEAQMMGWEYTTKNGKSGWISPDGKQVFVP